jgi:thiol-disulfide isomerase/thioredoxin
MGKVTSIGNQEFAASVEKATGTVVVDFTASWCPPCKMLAPVLERVAEKFDGQPRSTKSMSMRTWKPPRNTAFQRFRISCFSRTAKSSARA